jgi:hypothetical protein
MTKPHPNLRALAAQNIRVDLEGDDSELRESMKQYGWHRECPAIQDEFGVTLVGNRRMRIAAELNIEPVVRTLHFGQGDEADAARVKLALVSNTGFRPMSAKDRQRIAEHLYGQREWTMQRVAEALGVSKATISGDLRNCSTPEQLKPAKTAANPKGAGRPKGRKNPKPPPPMTRAQKLEQQELGHEKGRREIDAILEQSHREMQRMLTQANLRNVELEAQVAKLTAGNAALADELEAHDRARTAATPPPRRLTPDEIAKYVPPLPKTVDGLRYAAEAKSPEAKIAALEEKLKQRDRRITKLESENALQEEIAARDRRIKALTTEIQNLKAKSRMQHEFYETERERKGIMPFATYAKLTNCLHPDKPPPTQEQRQEAFGLLSQWKQASGKTR